MPNAAVHDTLGLVTAPIVGVAVTLLSATTATNPEVYGLACAVTHLAATIWLSPDLDTNSAIAKRWGPLGAIWLPYKWLIPHRSWLSHSGISGALRLLYLYLAIAIIAFVTSFGHWQLLEAINHFITSNATLVVLTIVGAVTADLVHVCADHLVTGAKRATRPKRRSSKKPRE